VADRHGPSFDCRSKQELSHHGFSRRHAGGDAGTADAASLSDHHREAGPRDGGPMVVTPVSQYPSIRAR